MVPRSGISGIVGYRVLPVSHDRVKAGHEIVRDRVRVGRWVIVLTEDHVRQFEDVAGDINPGGGGIGRRRNRIGDDVHAFLGYCVSLVAASDRIRDNRFNLQTIQPGGDIDPVVTTATATTILADVDLSG